MGQVDLHTHTTASDGTLTPTQLVHLAAESGLEVLGITDHDTTAGLADALATGRDFPTLHVIPGVELSTEQPAYEVHVLGYYLNRDDEGLQTMLRRLREARRERGYRMVKKLDELGLPISLRRVEELAGGGSIGRPHVARVLVEAGHVGSVVEAFERYIGRGRPAYVERFKLEPERAVQLVRQAGGVPVLAHPGLIADLEAILGRLIPEGLRGMEVYYAGYSAEKMNYLAAVAARHDLIPCGGSDYHGPDLHGGAPLGSAPVPRSSVARLRAIAEEMRETTDEGRRTKDGGRS